MASFAKNVFRLTFGNALAQAISIFAVPIITRLYSPEDFGLYVVYLSIVSIFSPIATLHFHRAMMLPDKRHESANLLLLSFIALITFSLIIAFLAFMIDWMDLLPKKWEKNGMSEYLWIIPLGVFITGGLLPVQFWALRHKKFKHMAFSRILEALSDRGLVLFLGFAFTPVSIGLIAGRIAGPLIASAYLFKKSLASELKALWKMLSIKEMSRLCFTYRDFPLFSTIAFIANSISRQLPTLLLALFFAPALIGFYGLVMTIIQMPTKFIGDAITKVFLQDATSNIKNKDILEGNSIALLGYLTYMALPPYIILLFFGEELFTAVFGTQWSEAGIFAQILSLSFFSIFLYRPLSVLLDVFKRQRQRLMFDCFLLISRGGAVVTTAYFGNFSIYMTLLVLAAVTFLAYTFGIFYLLSLLAIGPTKAIGIIGSKLILMWPILIGFPLLDCLWAEGRLTAPLVFSITFALMFQFAILMHHEPKLKNQVLRPFLASEIKKNG